MPDGDGAVLQECQGETTECSITTPAEPFSRVGGCYGFLSVAMTNTETKCDVG